MTELADNTPVLVGVAAVQEKQDDYRAAREPVALMEQALRDAASDAGCDELLEGAQEIMVPASLWGYSDPARLLAEAVGASVARTLFAEIGVSQQHVLDLACQRIVQGDAEIVLVAGGEARYRAQCAKRVGEEAAETQQPDTEPDVRLRPEAELWSEVESAAGLGMPVGYYAIMDSALRRQLGQDLDEHRSEMAATYARFSEIAAGNPDAWSDSAVAAEHIRGASEDNRMLAFPYTKLHNSQWNVNQAAGLVFCSAGKARELGIDSSKWVYPCASAEANFMSVVASRKDLGSCTGFRIAGRRVMDMAGIDFSDVTLRELYSCFPYAVRVQMAEFGLRGGGDLSVTGGMTFGGGPLNNFVFQATVKMAQLLRLQPEELGLVTTVSGMVTKQACALWSCTVPAAGWQFADVSEEVRASTDLCELVADYQGVGSVAGYTVLWQGSAPWRAIAVFDLPEDRRTVAFSENSTIMQDMMHRECGGLEYRLTDGQFYAL
ncbi:MAG: acetyl-CoA acetyltransferase [Pseudomonadota bacterium]